MNYKSYSLCMLNYLGDSSDKVSLLLLFNSFGEDWSLELSFKSSIFMLSSESSIICTILNVLHLREGGPLGFEKAVYLVPLMDYIG